MRIFKLTLIALAAVIAFSASAWAITVKKRIEAPGLPNEVWVVAGETFCTIKDWHPAVAECRGASDRRVRRCAQRRRVRSRARRVRRRASRPQKP